MVDVQVLIREAEVILNKISVRDLFGIGTREEYIDDNMLPMAQEWVHKVHDVGAKSLSPLGQELSNLWLLNGNRVSSARIKRAIEILKQIVFIV